MRKLFLILLLFGPVVFARADIRVINGVRFECKDGMCRMIEDDPESPAAEAEGARSESDGANYRVLRTSQGYLPKKEFLRWLTDGDEPQDVWMTAPVDSPSFWIVLAMILLGGLAMNLTPCVLPMVPINLMIIGKSAVRGAWYGLGIALAYGTLGVAAAVGGLAFGTIQGNPWFNLGICLLFVLLALSLLDVFFIDLSRFRPSIGAPRPGDDTPSKILNALFPFFMGVVSALLAGACVAPILISVLLLTGKLYAEGHTLSLGLPFVLGVGMALPWPFLGAGLRVLPKPGGWMKGVSRLFAALVLGFAVWYGRLAYLGFRAERIQTGGTMDAAVLTATPETFGAVLSRLPRPPTAESPKPILVDCWATWCKNCAAMDRVLGEQEVQKALEGFTVIRMQTEDMKSLTRLKGFESIRGLPAFAILSTLD